TSSAIATCGGTAPSSRTCSASARPRIDRREDAERIFDDLGDVEAQVVAPEIGVDLHADGQTVGNACRDRAPGNAEQVARRDEPEPVDGDGRSCTRVEVRIVLELHVGPGGSDHHWVIDEE